MYSELFAYLSLSPIFLCIIGFEILIRNHKKEVAPIFLKLVVFLSILVVLLLFCFLVIISEFDSYFLYSKVIFLGLAMYISFRFVPLGLRKLEIEKLFMNFISRSRKK
jgi:hypothetical protein